MSVDMRTLVTIHNVPDYATSYKYWICRLVNNELWFYESYNDKSQVDKVLSDLDNTLVITF